MGLFGKILGVALIAVAVVAVAASGGLGAGAAAPFAGSGFASLAGSTLGKLLTAAAFTLGQRALVSQPKFKSGIQTGATVSGEDQPESFIVGRYATAGAQTYPTRSFLKDKFLVTRIELSDLPGCTLSRVAVDGEWIDFGSNPDGLWGRQATGKYTDRIWVKYFDGSQTAASQVLIDEFGSDPNFPYDVSMVGAGRCYVHVIAKFDNKLFPSQPSYRVELDGIPLYDPRADTSVGGSGAQRWADKTTWTQTRNPMVIAYNILRGITLRDGSIWGGGVEADDLPFDAWFAAMNDCDEQVQIGGGVGNRYECGFEIKVNEQPADILEEIMKTCSGVIADVGGVWYPRVGAPDLPVFTVTDGVMLDFEAVGHTPHAGIEQTANAITVTYPDPSQIYEPREAPPRFNATWEAEDGQRLMRQISLPAVPFPGRAQIIAKELHEDERRQSRHILALPRTMTPARPGQVIDFTSDEFGHAGKDFEISALTLDLATLNVQMLVREVSAADFTPPDIIDTTIASPVNSLPEALVVTGFDVTPVDILDASGNARRPGFEASWTDPPADALGAVFELRITGTTAVVKTHTTQAILELSDVISGGIMPGQSHDIRMRYTANDRPTEWTAWVTRTATNAQITSSDMGSSSVTASKLAQFDGANLVPDHDLLDAEIWSNTSNATGVSFFFLVNPGTAGGRLSTGQIQYDGALPVTAAVGALGRFFEVAPGEKLRASYQVGRFLGTTHTARGRLRFLDRAGAAVGSPIDIGSAVTTGGTGLIAREAVITVPSGAFRCALEFVINSSDGRVIFAAPVVRRMNAAALVVDGGIDTDLLALRSVTEAVVFENTETIVVTDSSATGRGFNFNVPSDDTQVLVSISANVKVTGDGWGLGLELNGPGLTIDFSSTADQPVVTFEKLFTASSGTNSIGVGLTGLGPSGATIDGFTLSVKMRAR